MEKGNRDGGIGCWDGSCPSCRLKSFIQHCSNAAPTADLVNQYWIPIDFPLTGITLAFSHKSSPIFVNETIYTHGGRGAFAMVADACSGMGDHV